MNKAYIDSSERKFIMQSKDITVWFKMVLKYVNHSQFIISLIVNHGEYVKCMDKHSDKAIIQIGLSFR